MEAGTATVEREQLEKGPYRDALASLLAAQALPVWGWGLPALYQRLLWEGYAVDHWVRNANMWADFERNVWDWGQISAPARDAEAELPAWVQKAVEEVTSATVTWSDLALCQQYVDGLGHYFIGCCRASSYGPLVRTARLLIPGKWGHVATGHTHLIEMMRDGNEEAAGLRARVPVWRGIAEEVAAHISAEEESWAGHGLAMDLDFGPVLVAADARIDAALEGERPARSNF